MLRRWSELGLIKNDIIQGNKNELELIKYEGIVSSTIRENEGDVIRLVSHVIQAISNCGKTDEKKYLRYSCCCT